MKAYIWGNNQVISVANNKEDARTNALERLKNHSSIAETVLQTDPIEVSENKARVLWTSWGGSKP